MVNRNKIIQLLKLLQFKQDGNYFSKTYAEKYTLRVDINENGCIHYKDCGIYVTRDTTSNFVEPESLVVLECVDRLLEKGYCPHDIELEPHWVVGHGASGGFADIWVRTFKNGQDTGTDKDKDSLLLIECKKWDKFSGAWKNTEENGAQLFGYFQQIPETKFLCLYTSMVDDGKVKSLYHLINVQDNEHVLADNKDAASYGDGDRYAKFAVWRDLYGQDYATRGLFEDDIQPYAIGKKKIKVEDLAEVDNDTIQKKYNEFALILRQHNVGTKENAFDKLVNLFLAKVVDETNNPNDLDFYWKGAANDDDFKLQDRLQRLYRDGMKKFLGEDVTYIEDSEIDTAFRWVKNDPDATKKTIVGYFRALKFFSDNDFSFISVHNERLFKQNAVILRKVVRMLQDIRLKTSEANQNQFLGDLFEGFLNKGVKQSEGQFFTPMPIVRFLVSALPLEQMVKDSKQTLRAIDYACGAGHFLTEYAVRIKEFAEKHRKDVPINEYYAAITGIEKEYRLSKVSKVSAFMYGHDDIKIIYADALASNADVKDNSYDVLVANPPYAVKGFLETLTDADRACYQIFNKDLNLDKNNAIETFFIERAAQLLRTGGVAGIILPVSVLNKGGIYTHAREIILQNFEIVALTEFGSGTFGKTGTNTVIMFLRRKETNTPAAEHYKIRVNSWFNHRNTEAYEVYEDERALENYCKHCGYLLNDYKAFISGELTDSILATDTIKAYRQSFFGNKKDAMKGVTEAAKKIRTAYKERIKKKTFEKLPKDEQEDYSNKQFLRFVTEIEREKVYYYILATSQKQQVVLMDTPKDTTDRKKFLGYEWSDSKGREGIQYLNVAKAKDSEDGNEADDDTMTQIRGIRSIATPLFNPMDLEDSDKINSIIRKNFLAEQFDVPENLSLYVKTVQVVDMIDFLRTSFNVEFRTEITAKPQIESKYELFRIEDVAIINDNVFDPTHSEEEYIYVDIASVESGGTGLISYDNKIIGSSAPSRARRIATKGSTIVSTVRPNLKAFGFIESERPNTLFSTGFAVIHPKDSNAMLEKLLYYYFTSWTGLSEQMISKMQKGQYPSINLNDINNFLIPLPPIAIQQQIVAECSKVDEEVFACSNTIVEIKNEIEKLLISVSGTNKRIKNICLAINPSKADINDVDNETVVSFVEMASVSNDGFIENKVDMRLSELRKGGYTYFAEGDIIIAKITPCMENGKCALAVGLTNGIGMGSSEFHVIRANEKEVLKEYLFAMLNRNVVRESAAKVMTGSSGHRRVPISFYEDLQIPVPTPTEQRSIVNKLETLEQTIKKAKTIISSASVRKQAILDRYLR